ncbi:MAG TPA: hypothetical protein VFR37_14190 [Longimicrobium sp.]|nr:hypothetical protein [Longimicrobium sp.]
MKTHLLPSPLRGAALVVLLLASACTDSPISPRVNPTTEPLALLECRVHVHQEAMTCTTPQPSTGSAMGDIVGHQDRYIKLTNFGNNYDNGTDLFGMYVTVQNLLPQQFGTDDGVTNTGVYIFFYTDPSAPVTVANPDGDSMFIAGMSDYFHYPQILDPYEISEPKLWQFNMPGDSMSGFTFAVFADGARSGPGTMPKYDAVWQGDVSTDWFTAGNWQSNAVPGASSVVMLPNATLLGSGFKPTLTANASALHLRVSTGDSLTLGGFDMAVGGNLDAPGLITGSGSVTMSGSNALLRGNLSALFVTGSTFLQGEVRATGAVSVTGSLTVADSAMSISVP